MTSPEDLEFVMTLPPGRGTSEMTPADKLVIGIAVGMWATGTIIAILMEALR